jgi:hypothetical protein
MTSGWALFVQLCHQSYVPTLPPDQGETVRRLRSVLAEADPPVRPESAAADRSAESPGSLSDGQSHRKRGG